MGKPKGKKRSYKFRGNQHVDGKKRKQAEVNSPESSIETPPEKIILQDNPCQPTSSSTLVNNASSGEAVVPPPPIAVTRPPIVSNVKSRQVSGEDCITEPNTLSVSYTKMSSNFIENVSSNELSSGYRFMDIQILRKVVELLLCPSCFLNNVKLVEHFENKKGSAINLSIECDCGYENPFYSSTKNGKSFDVNKRFVYAMRSCGQGFAGMERFCTLMNMPKPLTKNNYSKTVVLLKDACKTVAIDTMKNASTDLHLQKNLPSQQIADIAVSCDGSWQRRGFSSLNGFVSAISMDTGKILDVEAMSRYCRSCQMHESGNKTSPAYTDWKASHKCLINYRGSAPGMEVAGTKKIFERSKNLHLRYTELFGDGDSKTFPAIENVYENDEHSVKVVKKECVGHVQKRVGNRLRKLKKKVGGLGGKGNLTESVIDRIQNYYGIAIRSNKGNVDAMKKGIYASWLHVSSSPKNHWHIHCPVGETSWCSYQRDKATGKCTHKPGPGLPLKVIKHIKPIMADLANEKLLERCLDGKTQNQNECFNNYVWRRIPKDIYVGKNVFEFGIYDAVSVFNIGRLATLRVFELSGLIPGYYTTTGCNIQNSQRLYHAQYKFKDNNRKRRKIIRGQKKSKSDKINQSEKVMYEPGGF